MKQTIITSLIVSVLIVSVVVFVALFAVVSFAPKAPDASNATPNFGALSDLTTITNPWSFTSTTGGGVVFASTTATRVKTGVNGTPVTNFVYGTCSFFVGTTTVQTIAASSTATVDCQSVNGLTAGANVSTALTGVQVGDNVTLVMPTTTPTTNLGLAIVGVAASSTNGFITAKVLNMTGGTFTWGTTSASGIQYTARR